jgi:hypothetical protein
MKKNIYFIVVITISVFSYCTLKPFNVEIDPVEMNPTEYTFHFSIDVIEDAIIKSFDWRFSRNRYCDNEMIYNGDMSSRSSGSMLWNVKTSLTATENDSFYLYNNECPSKVYFKKNGYPYIYTPDKFVFHIDFIADNLTNVRIEVINPSVIYGETWHRIPHGVRTWKYKEVLSTTVEEYEILQILGKTLGVNDMPEIKIPKKIVF